MQAHRKNMERIEERVAGADEQRLQHLLTESPWDHRAVLDQVDQEADRWLGGTEDSCLLIDEWLCQERPAFRGSETPVVWTPRQGG